MYIYTLDGTGSWSHEEPRPLITLYSSVIACCRTRSRRRAGLERPEQFADGSTSGETSNSHPLVQQALKEKRYVKYSNRVDQTPKTSRQITGTE